MKYLVLWAFALALLACGLPPFIEPAGPTPSVPSHPAEAPTLLRIQGEVLEEGTDRPIHHAIVYINGREVGRGRFSVEVAMNEQVLLRVEALGYLPTELVIRLHLDPTRPRLLTAPVRLRPDPASMLPN